MSDAIEREVRRAVGELVGANADDIHLDEPLIGPEARLKSRDLIMLVMDLEEFVQNEYRAAFDWTAGGDAATVQSRLQSVGTLVAFVRESVAAA